MFAIYFLFTVPPPIISLLVTMTMDLVISEIPQLAKQILLGLATNVSPHFRITTPSSEAIVLINFITPTTFHQLINNVSPSYSRFLFVQYLLLIILIQASR